jgi:hypothetical protein
VRRGRAIVRQTSARLTGVPCGGGRRHLSGGPRTESHGSRTRTACPLSGCCAATRRGGATPPRASRGRAHRGPRRCGRERGLGREREGDGNQREQKKAEGGQSSRHPCYQTRTEPPMPLTAPRCRRRGRRRGGRAALRTFPSPPVTCSGAFAGGAACAGAVHHPPAPARVGVTHTPAAQLVVTRDAGGGSAASGVRWSGGSDSARAARASVPAQKTHHRAVRAAGPCVWAPNIARSPTRRDSAVPARDRAGVVVGGWEQESERGVDRRGVFLGAKRRSRRQQQQAVGLGTRADQSSDSQRKDCEDSAGRSPRTD